MMFTADSYILSAAFCSSYILLIYCIYWEALSIYIDLMRFFSIYFNELFDSAAETGFSNLCLLTWTRLQTVINI